MKINKWICTVAIGALFASCQSVDLPTFSEEDTFVALQAKSFSVAENAGSEFKIPVNLVAISARDLTVNFEIDTTAYAGVNAAKPGVHYNLKNADKTLTFSSEGETVQYIVIEPINNPDYEGDVKFDIKLSTTDCNLGANYTATVTIVDDDHPLAAAGILGTYSVVGQSPFSNLPGPFNWTCVVQSDPDFENRVWFSQIAPDAGFTQAAVMGTVSDDMSTITILSGQSLGSDFKLVIADGASGADKSSTVASVSPGTSIRIGDMILVGADGEEEYRAGAYSIVMTKVQE